jgi:hypothetical protein
MVRVALRPSAWWHGRSGLAIDGTSAALVEGNLSNGGGITTSGLVAVTGTVSGAGSLTLDGGLANLGSLDSLKDDMVTTNSGMLFLSPAAAGDTYRLVQTGDRTAVLFTPTSHGMSDMAMADAGQPSGSLNDFQTEYLSADTLRNLGFNPGTRIRPSRVRSREVYSVHGH